MKFEGIHRNPADTLRDWPCQQGEVRPFKLALAMYARTRIVFIGTHGVPGAAAASQKLQNLRGEISRCPLCTRFAGALARLASFLLCFLAGSVLVVRPVD